MTSYTAIRTDKEQRELILSELRAGRLRQGWGYKARQDLRKVRRKRIAKSPLDGHERSAWRNRRMLEDAWDGIQDGGIVLLPNLPEQGLWVLGRVVGPYSFDPIPFEDGSQDYGHVRPVELLRGPRGDLAVIEPSNGIVRAGLRRSMRCQSRMWSLDQYADVIDEIIAAIGQGHSVSEALDEDGRLSGLIKSMRHQAYSLIDDAYGGAELEDLVVRVLRARYQASHAEAQVIAKGGAGEHGIDILVELPDPLGVVLRVGVQVKKHDGVEWSTESLDQIAEACDYWKIHAGVVITTASEISDDFEARRVALEDERGISIRVIEREEFVDMVLTHLATTMDGDGS